MPQKFKIAFFGSSLVSAYWNGAATYYRGIIKALNAQGHKVTFYEPDAYERQQHRDIADPDWARVVVYKPEIKAVYECLKDAENADIVVKASGVGVFDELLEKEVLQLQSPNRQVVFWDVDAPATLDRVEQNPDDPFLSLIPQYNMIFTYGGGAPVVSAYMNLGAVECRPIYNALDTSTHFPVQTEDRFRCDLTFLGNRLPDREARVDEFFFSVAKALPSKNFILGGNGWDDKDKGANVKYLGHVYTEDHNSLNSSPTTVLNISRESMARYGFSPATRVFEAAGAGACIITDYWKGIDHFFEPGKEILVARNGDEVIEILKGLTELRAREIGNAAYQKVLAKHTYTQRAIELQEVLHGLFQTEQASLTTY